MIASCLGIKEVEDPGKYLGLPIIWGHSKQRALAYVKEKVGKKVSGWQRRCLSFAGREVMIKAVINAIPTYSMSCFKFPQSTCKELDRMASNFYWGNSATTSSIHWKAWKHMVLSKQDGGLGFKDFVGFNNALLAKTAWRILQNPDAKWVKILKSIYFPHTSFMKAVKGGRASWGWDSILHGREFLKEELCWQVGTGHFIEVWKDPWIPGNPQARLSSKEGAAINENMLVTKLIADRR